MKALNLIIKDEDEVPVTTTGKKGRYEEADISDPEMSFSETTNEDMEDADITKASEYVVLEEEN